MRETETSSPPKALGRPQKLQEEHVLVLRRLVSEHPVCTLGDLVELLEQASGVRVSDVTLAGVLKRAGIVRVRPAKRPGYAQSAAVQSKRFGYLDKHRDNGDEKRYPSDLSDAEWALVADLFEPAPGSVGKPVTHSRRTMVDACCYVVRTGCAWRLLPKSFPAWEVVYKTFRRWSDQGRFQSMHDRLRDEWRRRAGRDVSPSVAVIDSQSTRGSPQGGDTGFDAGKRVKGRKRHLVVDSLGMLLAVAVTAASVQDRDGAVPVVAQACGKYASIAILVADSAYAGQCARHMRDEHGLKVSVVRHPGNRSVGRWHDSQLALFEPEPVTQEFSAMPLRWVVERTHAWIERSRRLVMHHDRRSDVAISWVWLTQARRLLRGLVTPNQVY